MECTLKNGFIYNALSEIIIDLRNIFQIAVSADPRYGPIYNVGGAQIAVGVVS